MNNSSSTHTLRGLFPEQQMAAMCLVRLALTLLSVLGLGTQAFNSQLVKCFEDPQYEEMVWLAQDGLGQKEERKEIVVIGTVQLRSPPEEVESYGDHMHITYQTPDTLTADYMIVATTATAAQLLRSQPPLSHGKENALRSFHYSGVTKVFLACMQSFWEHEGISGDESSTDWPSCFIHYPSHTFPSGTQVILASFTMDDNSFFAQAADVVLDDLATVHDLSKEELRALCPYSMIKHWSQDSYSMGGFALFTPYQYVDYAQELGWVHFAVSRPLQSRRKQIMENRSNVKSEYGRRLRNKTKPNHRP
ncbi:hypothetical protein R6Z07M_006915 [Ovis aries]